MKCRRWFVSGRVQGVFFRDFVRGRAQELALRGWVRNRRDGRVETEAWGVEDSLRALEEALRNGSPASRVEAVEEVRATGSSAPEDFQVRATE